jgi:aldose 1-epimerase
MLILNTNFNEKQMKLDRMIWLMALIAVVGCTNKQKEAPAEQTTLSGLKKTDFQSEVNGDSTDLYLLKNANGMEVAITNYGGRIVSVMVPDKRDK